MYAWSRWDHVLFIVKYLWAKISTLWEVRKPKFTFFWFELKNAMLKVLNALAPTRDRKSLYRGPHAIEMRNVIFQVREGSHDATIISPAYEFADRAFLFALIEERLRRGDEVHFVDVGANVGAFSIRVARRFPKINCLAIEPIAENAQMLRLNMSLNQIDSSRIHIHELAFSDRSGHATIYFDPLRGGDASMSSPDQPIGRPRQITLRSADEVLPPMAGVLVIKLDVEGHEAEVLKGWIRGLTQPREVYLLMEDGRDLHKCQMALELGFQCIGKFSPDNSWWLRKNIKP